MADVTGTEAEDYSQPILTGGAASDYERYLNTEELLALQKGEDEWVHRDELLFQVTHQSSELWLKLSWNDAAEAAIRELTEQNVWPNPIVTEVVPLPQFFKAEDYHQGYFRSNSAQPYCQLVVNPKLAKARKSFAAKMRTG